MGLSFRVASGAKSPVQACPWASEEKIHRKYPRAARFLPHEIFRVRDAAPPRLIFPPFLRRFSLVRGRRQQKKMPFFASSELWIPAFFEKWPSFGLCDLSFSLNEQKSFYFVQKIFITIITNVQIWKVVIDFEFMITLFQIIMYKLKKCKTTIYVPRIYYLWTIKSL